MSSTTNRDTALPRSPLYHGRVETPEFRDQWRLAYQRVNQRFADAAATLAAPGGIVWVHDYHLQAVPALLRRRRPDLRIGMSLHTPFPPAELFVQLPSRAQTLHGLLGADLIGVPIEVAAPDGPETARRERTRARIDRRVAQINGEHARVGHPVIHYLRHSSPLPERVALYLATDVFLATPLSAGTASTAKEFLIARIDNTARLVLSEFTAEQLPGVTTVNPNDPDALLDAITVATAETGIRSPDLSSARQRLHSQDVDSWVERFLRTLNEPPPETDAASLPQDVTVGTAP